MTQVAAGPAAEDPESVLQHTRATALTFRYSAQRTYDAGSANTRGATAGSSCWRDTVSLVPRTEAWAVATSSGLGVCTSEQRLNSLPRHAGGMKPLQMRIAFSTLWSCAAVAAGAVWLARSPAQWVAVLLLAAVPPAIVLHFWREPMRSTSQDIRDVLQ